MDLLEGNGRDAGEVAPMSITARRCEPWGVALGLTFFLLNHAFSLPIKYAVAGEQLGSEMATVGPLLFHVRQG